MSGGGRAIARVGVVIHPRRDVERPLDAVRDWARANGVEVVQLRAKPEVPEVAPEGRAEDVAVIVAIGGDGTVLAAMHFAAPARRPVLGVACGSIGALTTVAGTDVAPALSAFAAGDWQEHTVPALQARDAGGREVLAINDLVIVRAGGNQVSAEIEADGDLFGRFAGDGVIAATQIGSSAYALAAGGPLLAPGSDSWLVTPLAPHGGTVPALVLGAASSARLLVEPGWAGARVELDGQPVELDPREMTLRLRPDYGTIVRVGDEESYLAGLRRRGIVTDSPRVLARDARRTTCSR